jgi:DNA-binding beta-propeller fold protein YncE
MISSPTLLLLALLSTALSLPGGPPVGMDYLAYDPATNRVWIPAGNTGNVDVLDVATGKLSVIGGLATAPPRKPGRPRMGPSSATVAGHLVWIGNRGDDHLRAFDARTLAPKGDVALPTMPDGLAFSRKTHELWVTTPGAHSLTIVPRGDGQPGAPATLALDGDPEGYAVDDGHGRFYTNLEDKDRTLAIDLATRQVVASWPAGCGAGGPRGLALDGARQWLFVACTDGARVLDVAHGGKILGRLTTGHGVDNLDYDARRKRLFVASGEDGALVVARVTEAGALEKLASWPTAKGARNPVLDARGVAYVEDALGGQLLILDPSRSLSTP